MPKISVIVPVYNTEKYLKRCLDSILNQTYQDFEIIIINDGSTDSSCKIIEEYQKKFKSKIKSFYKSNGGLSSARNFGVTKVSGDYICFVDSDDFLDINLFKKLHQYIIQNIDIIKYKTSYVDENSKIINKISGPIFENCTGQDAFNKLVFKDTLIEPAWLYLYKSDFYKKNKFNFSLNKYHEDFGLVPSILVQAETFVSIDFYGYYYVQAKNSITRNDDYIKNKQRVYDILYHYDIAVKKIKTNNKLLENTKSNFIQYYSNAVILSAKFLNINDLKDFINEIKKRKIINNIKVKNFKQFFKKLILKFNLRLYLKMH